MDMKTRMIKRSGTPYSVFVSAKNIPNVPGQFSCIATYVHSRDCHFKHVDMGVTEATIGRYTLCFFNAVIRGPADSLIDIHDNMSSDLQTELMPSIPIRPAYSSRERYYIVLDSHDEPGLVEDLLKRIATCQGDVLHSRGNMISGRYTHLRWDQFAVLEATSPERAVQLEASLAQFDAEWKPDQFRVIKLAFPDTRAA